MSSGNNSWETWFDQLAPALVLFARQWLDSQADAEDVVQETFVKCWQNGFQDISEPKAYLFASVKRNAADLVRHRSRRRRRETKAVLERSGSEPTLLSPVEEDERRAAIESAMMCLPLEQRTVLVMKIWGDLTFAEISRALQISPNTAASRYRYALKTLRQQLSEEPTP